MTTVWQAASLHGCAGETSPNSKRPISPGRRGLRLRGPPSTRETANAPLPRRIEATTPPRPSPRPSMRRPACWRDSYASRGQKEDEEMKVEDLMTRDVRTVGPDASLKDVAVMLAEHRIGGMPVVDGSRAPLGVITKTDIVMKELAEAP